MRCGDAKSGHRDKGGTLPSLPAGIRLWQFPRLLGSGAPSALVPRLLRLALDAAQSRRSVRPSARPPSEGTKRWPPARRGGDATATARGYGDLAGWFLCGASHPAMGLQVIRRQARAPSPSHADFCCITSFRRVWHSKKSSLMFYVVRKPRNRSVRPRDRGRERMFRRRRIRFAAWRARCQTLGAARQPFAR